ncbi:hypothetical protein D915_006744 [Fasciola hepatica]|uniref:Uncharacterized protein n=1 Tax=Fasciola hepatica TaxID=6192 RepID=A0A4E0R945_FASHE|nr:hypothetical protein D915_006744 [Fasciola hepatica]
MISKQWMLNVIFVQLVIGTDVVTKNMCQYRLRKRDYQFGTEHDLKPCCLPETWKAGFHVHSIMGGKHKSRVDYGAFRIRRAPDGSIMNALLVVGKTVASPEFCLLNSSSLVNISNQLCPKDRVSCLHSPFLGEPRCLTETNGYRLKRTKHLGKHGKVRQIWFTDRINRLFGTIERHIYHVVRQYGLCGLVRYQIQWGYYALPWRNCRMFIKMEQTYVPVPGSFKLNFDHPITERLLFC